MKKFYHSQGYACYNHNRPRYTIGSYDYFHTYERKCNINLNVEINHKKIRLLFMQLCK